MNRTVTWNQIWESAHEEANKVTGWLSEAGLDRDDLPPYVFGELLTRIYYGLQLSPKTNEAFRTVWAGGEGPPLLLFVHRLHLALRDWGCVQPLIPVEKWENQAVRVLKDTIHAMEIKECEDEVHEHNVREALEFIEALLDLPRGQQTVGGGEISADLYNDD